MSDRLWRNTVRRSHVANVCGVRLDEVVDVGDELGFRTLNGRYERSEARSIATKLLIRTSNPARASKLRAAILHFGDEAGNEIGPRSPAG